MKRLVLTLGLMTALGLTGCGAGQDAADDAKGIDVEARQDILVSEEPLGDVVVGTINAGDIATALCYVSKAQTQTGGTGSAVKIESDQLAGYAPVTNFPEDPTEQQALFDVEQETLRNDLPACSTSS